MNTPCQAIVTTLVFGPQHCLATSVTEVQEQPWGPKRRVCAEHAVGLGISVGSES